MRLWSLHPSLLDARGLVALWREGLLARKVLQGRTRGYRTHPQLDRFRRCADPVAAVDAYLGCVYEEACARGYSFDATKIERRSRRRALTVTRGQLDHEWRHLRRKLRRRHPAWGRRLRSIRCHPLFRVVPGGVAAWEKAPK